MNLKVNEIALNRDKLKEVCFAAMDLNGLIKLRKEKEGSSIFPRGHHLVHFLL